MDKNMKKDLDVISKMISTEKVLWGLVSAARTGGKGQEPLIRVAVKTADLSDEYIGTITASEVDDPVPSSLGRFPGTFVPFVILGVNDAAKSDSKITLTCSRKKAIEQIKVELMPLFLKQVELEAKITKILDYGAYLDIRGVTGFLNNSDFSYDQSPVSCYYSVGDTILVKCKNVGEGGKKISFEAAKKAYRKEPLDVEPSDIMAGKVVAPGIRTFANSECGVFVRLVESGADVLCEAPTDRELSGGEIVRVQIKNITPKTVATDDGDVTIYRLRGKILQFDR